MSFLRGLIVSALCTLWLSAVAAKAQTATTQAATGVTDIAATLRGTVNPAADAVYSYCRFDYGTDATYGQTINASPFSVNGTTPVAVAANPPGLLPNTTYHYRVVMGPYSGGGYFGEDMTFTTGPPATLPSYYSVRADTIGDTAASFAVSNPNSGGSPTTVSIEYGTDANYGLVFVFPDLIPVNTTPSWRSTRVFGLTPDTTYHWRFKLSNAQGSTYSADQSFTTMRTPIVTTGAATEIASLAATFNGTVNPMQQVFEVRFEYGTDTSYGTQISATPYSVHGTGVTAVSARFGLLQPGTTYHYRTRAFASGIGAVTGPDQVFTTQSDIATLSATNVTDLGATVTGTVDVGSTYSRHTFSFEYGITTAYGQTAGATAEIDPLRPEHKIVTANLYNLLPGTLYHFRIKVGLDLHPYPVFYGSDYTFTTGAPATPPTILPSSFPYTTGAYAVVPTAATLSVSVLAGSSATTVTLEYGTDPTYGSQVVVPTSVPVSSSDIVSTAVTGLTPNTTYHYRFKATNNEGTVVGTGATFTTPALPDVSTTPASYVGSSWARANGSYNPRSANYAVSFDYGPSTAYGSSTGRTGPLIMTIGGNTLQDVYADLSGIAPSTTYHYRIKLGDGYGNFYYGGDATFTTVAPVEAWRLKFFNTTDGTGDRADLANPTGDGVPNLIKYALGLDPTKPGTPPTPYPVWASDGETYLTLYFSRVSVATDLTYEVQVTDNLAGLWTTIATSSGGTPFTGPGLVQDQSYSSYPSGGGTIIILPTDLAQPPSYPGRDRFVIVRDTVPMTQASQRFMRLRVTH